jgi:hypothetical protein
MPIGKMGTFHPTILPAISNRVTPPTTPINHQQGSKSKIPPRTEPGLIFALHFLIPLFAGPRFR